MLVLFVMCLIAPVGILLPMYFNVSDAWGEWSAETLKELIGYVPHGMEKYTHVWNAPLTNYSFNAQDISKVHQSGYYIVSGLFGATLTYFVMLLISKIMIRNGK